MKGSIKILLLSVLLVFVNYVLAFAESNSSLYGERIYLANKPVSGNGFYWDTHTLTLDGYEGCAFEINNEAEIILNGKNKIMAGPNGAGIIAYAGLLIDGNGSGSLDIEAKNAFGIHSYRYLTIRDTELNITSIGDIIAYGIYVSGYYEKEEQNELLLQNVTGTIYAYSEDNDTAAVHSFVPIVLNHIFADKTIGTFIEDGDNEYAFVNGSETLYSDESTFESNRASTVNFNIDDDNRRRANNVIVKGETINLNKIFPLVNNAAFIIKEKKMKKRVAINGDIIKGKRKVKFSCRLLVQTRKS